MTTVLIVIHLMVVLALIGIVLLQRSEGGALGIGGGSGAFMSGRGAGNVLTRSTAILAAVFFVTSIGLTVLARLETRPGDILDRLPAGTASTPATGAPSAPASNQPPATAADLLKSLGGASGPQTPPAAEAGTMAPAPEAGTSPQPAAPDSGQPDPQASTAPSSPPAQPAAVPAPAADTAPITATPPAQSLPAAPPAPATSTPAVPAPTP